jgi:hypothetical protein
MRISGMAMVSGFALAKVKDLTSAKPPNKRNNKKMRICGLKN